MFLLALLQDLVGLVISILLLGDFSLVLLTLLQLYSVSMVDVFLVLFILPLGILLPFPAGINALFSHGPRRSAGLARLYALWNITSLVNVVSENYPSLLLNLQLELNCDFQTSIYLCLEKYRVKLMLQSSRSSCLVGSFPVCKSAELRLNFTLFCFQLRWLHLFVVMFTTSLKHHEANWYLICSHGACKSTFDHWIVCSHWSCNSR